MSPAKNYSMPGVFNYDAIELSDKLFHRFSEKMKNLAGVDMPLTPKNAALIRNRVVKVLRRRSIYSFEDYWKLLETGNPEVISEFISALTTNLTSFFREPSHFDFLRNEIPKIVEKWGPEVRVWCAAASTGQEPYTIAMTILEALPAFQADKIKFLATDIDMQVLKKSATATYEAREMEGLSPLLKEKYFKPMQKNDTRFWRATDELHRFVRFAPMNLTQDKYPFQHKFHVIFCRNVLIYFDEPTTKMVIQKLTDQLAPGGYLILGHSESGNVKNPHLKPLSRAVYQKV